MKSKPLPTKQELLELFTYTNNELYWKVPSHRRSMTKPAGCIDKVNGYRYIKISGKLYLAHRLIYAMHYDDLTPELDVDHKEKQIPANNEIDNLRIATRSENCSNTSIYKNNTSGIKGVSWNEKSNKWKVQVMKDCKLHFGGLFTDIDEAKQRAKQLRLVLHGDFTNHGEINV